MSLPVEGAVDIVLKPHFQKNKDWNPMATVDQVNIVDLKPHFQKNKDWN